MEQFFIYSQKGCKYCVKVENYMIQNGLDYRVFDIADETNRKVFDSFGFTTVPQVFLRVPDDFPLYIGNCDEFIESRKRPTVEV